MDGICDFDDKIAIADITTGQNVISRFLIADNESSKPKRLAKRIGNNVSNTIPKINETSAIGLDKTYILNPDNPNFLAYHPVADSKRHVKKATISIILKSPVKVIINPTIEVIE